MGISSLNAALSYGVQADKDTAATALQTGLKTRSTMPKPTWDTYDPGPEHPGPSDRNTSRRSATQRTGYIAPFGSTGVLYPRLIGYQLRAAGFDVATTDETTHFSHEFTIATGADHAYISAVWALDTWTRMVKGARLQSLAFSATPQRIEITDSGIGMVSGPVTGSPTYTAEMDIPIKPTIGSGSILIGGIELTTGAIKGHQWTVTNALDTEDYQLWVEGRNDIPQTEIGLAGSFDELDIDKTLYEKVVTGGVSDGAPDSASVMAVLDILYQSAENITGAAVPYSLQMEVEDVELDLGDFEATGSEIVRGSIDYEMIDLSAVPLKFTLINDVASYA